MRRDVFHAIADPTRRQIIQLLSDSEMNLNNIASNFNISRSAVSQQVRILEECGLVRVRTEGRERYCEAKLNKLKQVSQWVGHFKSFWNRKLDNLEQFLMKEVKQPKKKLHGRGKKSQQRKGQRANGKAAGRSGGKSMGSVD